MPRHYVTFGWGHAHSIEGKTFDKDTVAVYEATDSADGRKKAFEYFDSKFYTDYHETEWKEDEQMEYCPKGYVYLGNLSHLNNSRHEEV